MSHKIHYIAKVVNLTRIIKFKSIEGKIVEWQWKMVARMEVILGQKSRKFFRCSRIIKSIQLNSQNFKQKTRNFASEMIFRSLANVFATLRGEFSGDINLWILMRMHNISEKKLHLEFQLQKRVVEQSDRALINNIALTAALKHGFKLLKFNF